MAETLQTLTVKEKIKECWKDKNWLWSYHQTSVIIGCSLWSARRAIKSLVKEGWIEIYGRNLSAGKTLFRRI